MDAIYLSRNDLELLRNKRIGGGSEADVYYAGNKMLYKIYHNSISEKVKPDSFDGQKMKIYPSDDSDIKIVDNMKSIVAKKIQSTSNFSSYYDKENVKLYHSAAILKAIERQSEVQYTHLPKSPVYLEENGKLIGCVLRYHRMHYNLHSFSFLPLKTKMEILKKVLRNQIELLNVNIYHLDLANKKVCSTSHSNILLSLTLQPQIIDIDGKSAIYTERPEDALNEKDRIELTYRNQRLYNASLRSFSALLLDFLFDEDIIENCYDTMRDMELLYQRLRIWGLPRELSEELTSEEVSLEALQKTLSLNLRR